jgi:hypothetical protein
VFENRAIRRILGLGRRKWQEELMELHSDEQREVCSSPDVISLFRLNRLR